MTAPISKEPFKGLDGAIAVQSGICRLSAEDGRLSYRGYDVGELAANSTYEETAYLLIDGHVPSRAELRAFEQEVKGFRKISPAVHKAIKAAPVGADPMAALRSAIATAAFEDAVAVPPSAEAARRQGLRLLGQLPTMVAAYHRRRAVQRAVTPKKSLSYAANFLYMMSGEAPSTEAERALDAALILRADNELNPSTFAARVTAATGADVYGSVSAALSALAGPRHGWHAKSVLHLLEDIGGADKVPGWVRGRLESKGRIAGFGHQVYQGEDPRTPFLRSLAEARCEATGFGALFRTAQALEAEVVRTSGQHPIVDFYLAPLYRALGIPGDTFTAVFAVSRISGWIAHILEQYGDERLIRPRAEYTGPVDLQYRPARRRR